MQLVGLGGELGDYYLREGRYSDAEAIYQRCWEIVQVHCDISDTAYQTAIDHLVTIYSRERRSYEKAESLRTDYLAKCEQRGDQSLIENAVWQLASHHFQVGKDAQAASQYQRLAEYQAKTYGEQHSYTMLTIQRLGYCFQRLQRMADAERCFRQYVDFKLAQLEQNASVQSERQQLANVTSTNVALDQYFQVVLPDPQYYDSAAERMLLCKGIVFRRQEQLRALRTRPELGATFTELQHVVGQLATEALRTPTKESLAEWRGAVQSLSERKERLEGQLMTKSSEYRAAQKSVSLAQIKEALPPKAIFIVFWESLPYSSSVETQLVAMVVRKDQPVWFVRLGSAKAASDLVDSWRGETVSEQGASLVKMGISAESRQAATKLRQQLWEPLKPFVDGALLVLISSTGVTARIPWAALPGRTPDSYLLEEATFVSVPIPQALVQRDDLPSVTKDRHMLAIGDVDYSRAVVGTNPTPALASGSTRGIVKEQYQRLPGTRDEVAAIERLHARHLAGQALMTLTNERATEAQLRLEAPRHRVLHLATHGFFASAKYRSELERSVAESPISSLHTTALPINYPQGQAESASQRTGQGLSDYHPGLLSGVVLSGANQPPANGDDGILTAEEVQTLSLKNVDLVTLSACETGLGQTAGGEGLLGL